MCEIDIQISPEHQKLVDTLRRALTPWRKFTIVIDGFNGAGKSTLARFLSWQLGMPTIELDMLFTDPDGSCEVDAKLLSRLISVRHDRDRPVIVEGILALRALAAVNVAPDWLIYVEVSGEEPALAFQSAFEVYDQQFSPRANANLIAQFRPTDLTDQHVI
jgi:hypothetical protein